jgi:hypothetical protein
MYAFSGFGLRREQRLIGLEADDCRSCARPSSPSGSARHRRLVSRAPRDTCVQFRQLVNDSSLACMSIFSAPTTRPSSTSEPSTALTAARWRRFMPLRSMCGLPSSSIDTKSAMFTPAILATSRTLRFGVKSGAHLYLIKDGSTLHYAYPASPQSAYGKPLSDQLLQRLASTTVQ